MEERQSLQEYFRGLLLTVVGQALDAAGYHFKHEPMQWLGGRFRFHRSLDDGLSAYIDYQVLVYADNMWVSGVPSRFSVMLTRSDQPPGQLSQHPRFARRALSQLVVDDFGVSILPSADHWWTFHDTDSLGKGLAESGHLLIGYGLPWLAGELTPGADDHQAG